jgi:cation:H+ antiporter
VDVAFQVALLVGGLALALVASDAAVAYARALAAGAGLPTFVVGVVLVGVGTDLPEIANSVASHVQDEGDVNVGDSVGSALTQDTLALGIAPLIIAVIVISPRQVGLVAGLTVVGLLLTAWFVSDGHLGRLDGAILILAWLASVLVVTRLLTVHGVDDPPSVRLRGTFTRVLAVLGLLVAVGAGATVAVRALVDLAEQLGAPTFLLAFFGASLGTSAPEVVVVVVSLLRGAPAIALGDALGSSLADSMLSVGTGPLVQPAAVTARLGVIAAIYTATAVAIAGLLLCLRRRHDRRSGAVLIGLYALSYVVLIGLE